MKYLKRVFPVLAFAVCFEGSSAKETLKEVLKLGLPVINVVTDIGRFPKYEPIYAPQGCAGRAIIPEKLSGSVSRIEPDGTVSYSSGPYVKSESGMTFRVRGNGSAYNTKKPYKIKLQKKADLLRRQEGDTDYRDKNWNLMSDRTRRASTGFFVNNLLKMSWTPACEYVNLVVNDQYEGVYLLVESVERNKNCRLNVSETGFVAEHDAYWWKDPDASFPASPYPASPIFAYTLKYPDFEDLTSDQHDYIQRTLSEFEASRSETYYPEYVDVESAARWVLGHDIMGTNDPAGANRYICKYDNTPDSKLFMGNLWDFDSTEDLRDDLTIFHRFYFEEMFNNTKNQAFLRSYLDIYDKESDYIFDALDKKFENEINQNAGVYDKNAEADFERWRYDRPYYLSVNAERQRQFYSYRRKSLKKVVDDLRPLLHDSGVSEITEEDACIRIHGMELIVTEAKGRVVVYDLNGCKIASGEEELNVTLPFRGVYILTLGNLKKKIAV